MRMRLVRDNDDPTLLGDLERLAGGEPVVDETGAGAESVDAGTDADALGEEVADAGPLDDPFVRGFVRASVHLKRYVPFYAGAAVWAATMLLIQPHGAEDAPAFAGTTSANVAPAAASSDLSADEIAAPTFAPVEGASFAPAPTFDSFGGSANLSLAPSFDQEPSAGDSEPSGGTSAAPPQETTFDFGGGFDGDDTGDGPALSIVRSGYASATGGTPADQEPAGGGLPVAVTLGNDTKRSFIEVAGEGTELRLRQSPDGAIQGESAVLKACPMLSADWKADRGQQLNGSPEFESACSTGSFSDGVWTFDLTAFTPEELARGLALTPGPGTAHTFEVVLEPTPVPPAGASEG